MVDIDLNVFYRKLFQLTGSDQLPYIQPSNKLQLPRTQVDENAVHWHWALVHNSARQHGQVPHLSHWIKQEKQPQQEQKGDDEKETQQEENKELVNAVEKIEEKPVADYPFAAFNTSMDPLPRPNDDEYQLLFEQQDVENGWSGAETDYLFDLCEQYDLRFLVIHDRYSMAPERSVEDLKERYFHVAKTVLAHRNPLGDPVQKAQIAALTYDKDREVRRLEYIEALFNRSRGEVEREQRLLMEIRRFQQEFRSAEKMRDDLMRSLRLDHSYLPTLSQVISEVGGYDASVSSSGTHHHDGKKKKHKRKDQQQHQKIDTANASATAAAVVNQEEPARKPFKKPPAVEVAPATPKRPPPILRSQTLPVAKTHIVQQKVLAELMQLDLPSIPSMVTPQIAQHWEELHQSLITLTEVKKQCERLENQLRGFSVASSPSIVSTLLTGGVQKSATAVDDTSSETSTTAASSRKRGAISGSSPALVPKRQRRANAE